MKKLITYILLITVFYSCIKKREKPFIIVYKNPSSNMYKPFCRYEYEDKNGISYEFGDLQTKYNVGDTIK